MSPPTGQSFTHPPSGPGIAHVQRDGEARFRLMADSLPQIVWLTDAQGNVEFFNKRWRDYTGIDRELDNAAEVAAAAVHPDDVALTIERFSHAQRSGGMFEVEHRIRSASGSYRWFLVCAHPYRDPDTGAVIRWCGASLDIHDRREAEIALHRLAARQSFQLTLSDLLRPLHDPYDIVDAASKLLGGRLRAERVFYGETDESGQFLDLTRDWTSGKLPSMAGKRLRLDDFGPSVVDEVRSGRTLAVSDVTVYDKCAEYADAYLANGVRSFLGIPLIKEGQLRATLNIHRADVYEWTELDIAMANDMVDRTWEAVERARAQARLRAERDRSQSVFDGMTEGFALLSQDWTVLEMNDEGLRIAQRCATEAIGKNHWEVWPETIGTESEQRHRRVMASGIPETWEFHQTFSNGHAIWVEARAYSAGNDAIAVFFRDITERRLTKQKLRDADRRKDEFLAMLAHELRNPLAPIGAAAQIL